MKRVMKYMLSIMIILVFMAVLLAFAFYAHAKRGKLDVDYKMSEENKLIVYTSHKKEVYEPIIKEFEERTGIWVQVIDGGTTEMLDRIAEENGKNSGDVMFGGGVDSLEAYREYFMAYESSQNSQLNSSFHSSEDKWTEFSKLPIVFIYNKKLVYSAGTPRSWKELLNSHWKGKIAFADPNKSGTSYTAICTMLQILSKDKDEDQILQEFINNINGDWSADSAVVLDDVISGKKLVGVTLEEAALKRIAAGENLGMVYPKPGTSALPDGTAIINGAPHEENAKLFLEFTVSEDAQHFLEEVCYRRPVRTDIPQREQIQEIEYDLSWASQNQNRILSLCGKKE